MAATGSGDRDTMPREADTDSTGGESSFARNIEHVPAAFALTRGPEHTLVYGNTAFRRLTAAGDAALGHPIADALAGRDTRGLEAALDRAFRTGLVARDQVIEPLGDGAPAWRCTVWPELNPGAGERLIVELRVETGPERTLALQRDVAERMLLSALRERDVASAAEASSRRATFLAAEGRRLAGSLDEEATQGAIAGLSLPGMGASWSIVDVLDEDGAMRRLAIVHPDPAKQALLRELEGRWAPEPGDPFGLPAALESGRSTVIAEDVDAALAAAAHDPETLRILRELGVGPLLTVPLVVRDRLLGAVTFVGGQPDRAYTPADVALAEELAGRSAMALDSARLYAEAAALRTKAEAASQAKSAFLGAMSHELRTPLNAIGGYVDLMELGLRGAVSELQRSDLARIRSNQQHLLTLITDVLNLVRLGSGGVHYDVGDVVVADLLAGAVGMVEPLIAQKQLVFDGITSVAGLVARADPAKLTQIFVNLLSNAVKFTEPGGRLAIDGEATEDAVLVRISDTGIGIPPDRIEAIFDPFVQVRDGLAGRDTGVGLGLAISRDLARGMGGDLTVESEPGAGSTFTVRLPRAEPEHTKDGAEP